MSLLLAAPLAVVALAQEQSPAAGSVVDYLKAKGRPSDLNARAALFREHFGAGEPYKGTAEQNVRLLSRLLAADEEARRACEAALAALPAPAAPAGDAREVVSRVSVPSFVVAPGFGVHGSYALEVRARVRGGKIEAKDFSVAVATSAARLGRLQVEGRVEVLVGGAKAPAQTLGLVAAWFPTLQAPGDGTAWRHLPKDSAIELPAGQRVEARVRVAPTVKTSEGVVPLWSHELVVVLAE